MNSRTELETKLTTLTNENAQFQEARLARNPRTLEMTDEEAINRRELAETHYQLGGMLQTDNDREGAITHYGTARLITGHPEASLKLKALLDSIGPPPEEDTQRYSEEQQYNLGMHLLLSTQVSRRSSAFIAADKYMQAAAAVPTLLFLDTLSKGQRNDQRIKELSENFGFPVAQRELALVYSGHRELREISVYSGKPYQPTPYRYPHSHKTQIAMKLMKAAALQGDTLAKMHLVQMYNEKMDFNVQTQVAINRATLPLLESLAEGGHAGAMYELYTLFNGAEGITADRPQAINWLRKSAEGGFSYAQSILSDKLAIDQSYQDSARWHRLARTGGEHKKSTGHTDILKREACVVYKEISIELLQATKTWQINDVIALHTHINNENPTKTTEELDKKWLALVMDAETKNLLGLLPKETNACINLMKRLINDPDVQRDATILTRIRDCITERKSSHSLFKSKSTLMGGADPYSAPLTLVTQKLEALSPKEDPRHGASNAADLLDLNL
jgi:hypothetical protein